MNFESLHLIELDAIRFIHAYRTPFFDACLKCFDFFDRQEFFFVLVPIIWLGFGWKAGLRFFSVLFVGNLVNHALKVFFAEPRPFHLDPILGIIQVGSYGFPSGAAQFSILLWGLLLSWRRTPWTWAIALFYITSVSFSRVYLGVHFPTDILGGWLTGALLLLLYYKIDTPIEERLSAMKPGTLLFVSQVLPLALVLLDNRLAVLRMASIAMGMGWGLWLNHRLQWHLPSPSNYKTAFLRIGIGILGTFIFYKLTSLILVENETLSSFIRFFLLGLWASLGCNFICRKLTLQNNSIPGTV